MTSPLKAFTLAALALALATMGVYSAIANEAPGAAVGSSVLMIAGVFLGVRALRSRLSTGARRATLAAGAVLAVAAAVLIHADIIVKPLFAQAPDVPSVSAAPSPQWTSFVERARPIVRAAVMDQNLPGVSVAVGTSEGIVWAEGFGWRDIVTQTPLTPETRFNIGSATPPVSAAAASLGLINTGTDTTADWSPSHNGEPEDDFPPFTLAHDLIFRPIGLAPPAQPLKGDRATIYAPRSDDHDPRGGRRPMYMRDFACFPDGKTAFYSTPSDLARFGVATKPDSLNGELAGGTVMSLVTRADKGLVVVVASNIAHANTAALAQHIAGLR